jgi:hypothetical protein
LAAGLLLLPGAATPASAQAAESGGNGTWYVATYNKAIHVLPESSLVVTAQIPLRGGIPTGMQLSQNRQRLYITDARLEVLEIVDVARRQSVDTFSLSHGNAKVRIWSLVVEPQERFAIMLLKKYTKQVDRFEVGPPTLVKYDFAKRAVTDTIPWPEGEEKEFAQLVFSPDGKFVYFFADDILVLDAGTFKEVDRWQLSQPLEEGMGRFNFGWQQSLYDEPGYYTGLFRITDPVQNRRIMGVARVNLVGKSVDFYPLGPDQPIGFNLAPDRRKAYGLRQQVGNWEFWTFDLEGRRVAERVRFQGRPRMRLTPSTNGRVLYIHGAGSTFDLYDATTFRPIRTVTLDADMITSVLIPPGGRVDR